MFRHSLKRYFIAAGILVLCFVSFFGYMQYQEHVEFKNFMSGILASQQSVDNTNIPRESSLSSVVKVETENTNPEDIKVDKDSKPVFFDLENMVKQRVQAPDGTTHEILVPKGHELKEGDVVSESFFDQPPSFDFEVIKGGRIKKSEIPEGESVESYTTKQMLSKAYGVSIEEIEKMMERGDIIVKRSPIDEFSGEDLLHKEAPEHDSSEDSDEDADVMLIRPDSPPATSDLPDMSGSKASPPNMSNLQKQKPFQKRAAELEQQLMPEGIEGESRGELSPERFSKAQQLIGQYGSEEGLRRLRETAPDLARQFEREQREPKMNTEP
ncbi:hypothetical protein C6502_11965 [Candidatus Poribacteria bacterium]|nr:MAG: hypothetical protein C6502_11965 [Candidatus Poribacteria bacterium]